MKINKDITIRGKIISTDQTSAIISFIKTNKFWDKTDVGLKDKPLTIHFEESFEYKTGDTILVKGNIIDQGNFKATNIYANRWQPIGVDWLETFILLIAVFLAIFIYKVFKEIKR